ncbi:cytochrome P450 71A9-like [Tasmannia lanceolata]|uniref:cytochrome P450 71A9-like n=1 Tax=Tasmannia lanceolata TaxID=3420 RepID=UPI004062EEF7
MALNTLFSWLPFLPILLLLPLLLLSYKNKTSKPSKLPPGPSGLPIIGNLHQLGKFPHRSLALLSRKHGPLMYLQLGHVPTLVVSSAEMAKQALKTQDLEICSKPGLLPYKKLSYNLLDVAFAPYGPYWRQMRKVCVLELFSSKRVQSFGFIRKEEVVKMIQSISQPSSLEPVNLSVILHTYTKNGLCKSAFGKTYEGKVPMALEKAKASLGSFFVSDFLPWMWWIDVVTGLHAKLDKIFMELDAFYEGIIAEHLDPNRSETEHEDLVDVLLQLQPDQQITMDHIKGVIMDILVAGSDTTTAGMVWAMSELIRNPRAMEKVQKEVRSTVGRKEMVEESDLHKLVYLESVVKETLRLHPPGPLLVPRETMEECMIDGYKIFPKTMIIVNAAAIGRDPNSWENPDEFYPERFISNSIDYKGQDFELLPFGAGRRGCPGMYFGVVSLKLALANLLYSFNWELPAGMSKEDVDMTEAAGISVVKKSPLHLVPIKYNSFISNKTED